MNHFPSTKNRYLAKFLVGFRVDGHIFAGEIARNRRGEACAAKFQAKSKMNEGIRDALMRIQTIFDVNWCKLRERDSLIFAIVKQLRAGMPRAIRVVSCESLMQSEPGFSLLLDLSHI